MFIISILIYIPHDERVTVNNVTPLRKRSSERKKKRRLEMQTRVSFLRYPVCCCKIYNLAASESERGEGLWVRVDGGVEGEGTIQWSGNYATEFATSRPP